ncbi:MAG TPA: peptidoglycan-binding domain-containing protein [Candidatus Limnocylindrales bacterium]|nr:peptidoglycan-binding domain-containing protein [Candidatus Limnocylindrales bacterium]
MDVMRARAQADVRRRGAAAVPEEELARLTAGADSAEALGPIDPAAVRSEDLPGLGRAAGNRAVADLVANGRSGPAGGPPTMQLLPAGRGRIAVQRQSIEEDDPLGAGGGGAVAPAAPALAPPAAGTFTEFLEPEFGGPAAKPEKARPTLRKGSRGPSVVDLQGRLNDRGADPPLATDGIFGKLTKAAVISYQSKNGLDPDGVVGPLTWGSLTAGQPDVPPDVDPLAGLPVQVLGHGASDAAVAAARTAAIELFGDMRDPNRAQLLTTSVALDVIPHDKQLTDLPEYAHLKGTKTFDGRIWDTVRGIQTDIAGVHRFAVAEEDLISVPGKAASYGSGFLAAHEGGHALQASSLTPAQITTLTTLYTTRLATSGPITPTTPASDKTAIWLNPAWYSAANKEEYFGNSVAAYLGHPYTDGDADKMMYNRSWLQTNDPGMYTLLETIYTH